MIRVVLDTNVVLSALFGKGGLPEAILILATKGIVQAFISDDILAEYEDVFHRPHFALDPKKLASALGQIRAKFISVKPSMSVDVSGDPDDNMFLECAEAAAAHYLVTGNMAHFPRRWKDTRVVTPREFLTLITQSEF